MTEVAYQYGNCYWNASGEFECLKDNRLVTKTVLEKSIKRDPPIIPMEHQQGFVQPTSNYARVPIDYKSLERRVIEPYNDPGHRKGIREFGPGYGRNDRDSCPLNREMEVSVYLPDRDTRFPWDQMQTQVRDVQSTATAASPETPRYSPHLPESREISLTCTRPRAWEPSCNGTRS